MGGARMVDRKPDEVRRSKPVNLAVVEKIHLRLKGIAVTHRKDPDAKSVRALFRTIREHRNDLGSMVASLLPKLGRLRSDLSRVEQVIEAEGAEAIATGKAEGENAEKRKANLKRILKEWYEARGDLRTDLHLIEAALAHVKWVREELRYAFEEASRTIASIELEHRIEKPGF